MAIQSVEIDLYAFLLSEIMPKGDICAYGISKISEKLTDGHIQYTADELSAVLNKGIENHELEVYIHDAWGQQNEREVTFRRP